MKRYLILIVLLIAVLVACGSQPDNELTVETKAPAETTGDEETDTDEADADADAASNDEEDDEEVDSSETEGDEAADAATPLPTAVPPTIQPAVFVEASDELKALLPTYDDDDIDVTASGLRYVILEATADGEKAKTCDTVDAHYTGYLPDGTKFDSSRDRDQTFQFPVGQGSVIPGWDEGFTLLAPGDKAILMIPPELGYGEQGGGTIPPNSTLYFDVELVGVDPVPARVEVADADYTFVPNDVRYAVIQEGEGDAVGEDKVLVLDFVLWDTNPNACPLANSVTSGRPIAFQTSDDNMFQAMIDGVDGIKLGEQRQIYMPEAALVGAGFQPGDYTFLVTLSDTLPAPPDGPQEADVADFTEVEGTDGIRYYDLVEGDGDEVSIGDSINVVYHVWTADGEMVTSSAYSGQAAVPVQLGLGQLPGFDEALPGATIGSTRQIFVPADVVGPLPGTGEAADVTFEVEIVEMTPVE